MRAKPLPDIEYLRECFDCDPKSGILTWRRRPEHHFKSHRASLTWNTRFSGRQAGWIGRKGELNTTISYKHYICHRIVLKMMTGVETVNVDHRNRSRADNAPENLRPATMSQNRQNSKVRRDSQTGLRGISFFKKRGVYHARIQKDGKITYLGRFATASEAHAAYCKAAQDIHGEYWNPG